MQQDAELWALVAKEQHRQANGLELIASENFTSAQVQAAAGSVLTNKYAEGLPGKRYYGGCEVVDEIETLAITRAKQLFGATWANVQPHSGSQANAAVMLALLQPGDKILGFSLAHGGHLTHGAPVSFSGKLYQAAFYGVQKATGRISWDEVEATAHRVQPRLLICGASAYSRDWDYARLRNIADQVGAFLLADIAHPAGLIARGLLNDPLPHCHCVTTTTHKTLRGPRGGMILLGQGAQDILIHTTKKGKPKKLPAALDSSVFPGTQGGPHMHLIAAKALAFGEALSDAYLTYVQQVQKNAHHLALALLERGYHLVTGGTDNHLVLVDLRSKSLTGLQAEQTLAQAGITVNKNMIPFDPQPPAITSGIRLGTPAITTRGLQANDMGRIVALIDDALAHRHSPPKLRAIKQAVSTWMHPLPHPAS